MSFCRSTPHTAHYLLDASPLDRVFEIKDLGIILDPKLKFDSHISFMVNKAINVLGFIKRWSKEFNEPYTTKTLYPSLVRPIPED